MKKVLTETEKFERKLKNLEPNTPYTYFTGESIGFTRVWRKDVDYMARFARACFDLGYAQIFQRRNRDNPTEFDHVIVLHEKLGLRVDGNGRFQEAQRVAALVG